MRYKTAELTGALLDAAVALAEGLLVTEADEHPSQPGYYRKTREEWGQHIVRWYAKNGGEVETNEEGGWQAIGSWGSPSSDWAMGGPIIERERITVLPAHDMVSLSDWRASTDRLLTTQHEGPTPLIAAMRAFVASKLGDEVELP